MFYNNLIYFLVVIFVLSTNNAPDAPELAPVYGLPLFILLLFSYYLLCVRSYRVTRIVSAARYFSAERRLSILAVLFFCGSLYFFDLKYYLHPLSLSGRMPVLENIGGLGIFFIFLAMMWVRARRPYELLFRRSYRPAAFVAAHIKINLPIILPWLILSLVFDLLGLWSVDGFQQALNSPWGDVFLFCIFVLFLLLFFPPLVRWLWNCKPMPQGPLRMEIEEFCRRQNFSSEILYWPLFEGRVLTAGIMGIIPGLRYLLITPALLGALNSDELEAVLAHEIGHVKKKHLLLYLFLFLGFSLFTGAVGEQLPYLLLGSDLFYTLVGRFNTAPETLIAVLSGVPLLVMMLVYFRFIFGYFLRNFERQADLYVFKAQGSSSALKSSFEKIAHLSGNIRDQKSWHHFGIGERIDFLDQCEKNRLKIHAHDRKIYLSLLIYFLLIAAAVGLFRHMDRNELTAGYESRYLEAVLGRKMRLEPNNGRWLLLFGDLMQEQKMEGRAIEAYEKGLRLVPMNAEINNNLAWLFLSARDASLRDPVRALALARRAASLKKSGSVQDTLAVALWANGRTAEAISVEMQAMQIDRKNRDYYMRQIEKFRLQHWGRENP